VPKQFSEEFYLIILGQLSLYSYSKLPVLLDNFFLISAAYGHKDFHSCRYSGFQALSAVLSQYQISSSCWQTRACACRI